MLPISVTRAANLKAKPTDESKLGFGKIFTDHMFLMDYEEGKGWHNARIEPYHNFEMDPATTVLHYGQAIFEGTKCYRRADGGLQLFRPQDNLARMTRSAKRMGMPALDEETALEGLKRLMQNGFRFSETESNRTELQQYREDSDSVLSFVKDCCETGDDDFVCGSTELFNAYKAYCEESGLKPYAQKKFIQQILTSCPGAEKGVDKTGRRRIVRRVKIGDALD